MSNTILMNAAVLAGPQQISAARVPLPDPARAAVRVRLQGSGVCGSNLPVWEGRPWFTYPLAPGAPGHEGWGHVEALGDGCEPWRVGDRVAVLSYHAFAEFDVAPADALVRLPPALEGQPFPGEALGCAFNVFRRCDVQPGHTVAIVGVGFLGALLTRLAANAGARVIAISRRPFARELARKMGAQTTLPLEHLRRVVKQVDELTAGVGCDRVIEAVGAQEPLDLAAELTRERGRLIIAGYHQDGPRQVNLQLWNWRGLDVINAHERDPAVYVRGMREAVDAVASGQLDPTPLYTHQFRLDELGDAMRHLRDRPERFLKALVTYD